jgi:hypothetical protein
LLPVPHSSLQARTIAAGSTQQAGHKEDIGPLVREYLLANPELIEEVQQALQAKRDEQKAKSMALAAI